MRTLIFVSLLTMSVANAADIQCAKVGRSSYPVSADAKKLADHLKVKTCSGKTFKYAVKELGQVVKQVAPTQELIDTIAKQRESNMKGKLQGFSFN